MNTFSWLTILLGWAPALLLTRAMYRADAGTRAEEPTAVYGVLFLALWAGTYVVVPAVVLFYVCTFAGRCAMRTVKDPWEGK